MRNVSRRSPWRPAGRRRLLVIALCAAVLLLLTYSVGLSGLDGDDLLAQRAFLSSLAAAHPVLTACAFAATYTLGMSLALPLGGLLGLVAGFLFGRPLGTALLVVAGTVSAALVFTLARRIAGDTLLSDPRSGLGRLAEAMRQHGFGCVLALRIIPAFPFFAVNLVAALAGISMRPFLVATALGKVPAALIYTGLGEALGGANSLGDAVTSESVAGLTALGLLALLPLAYRVWRRFRAAPLRPRS